MCDRCKDHGVIVLWGPNEGCAEFMDGPEAVEFCDCPAADDAKREMEEWEAGARALGLICERCDGTGRLDRNYCACGASEAARDEDEAAWERKTEASNR